VSSPQPVRSSPPASVGSTQDANKHYNGIPAMFSKVRGYQDAPYYYETMGGPEADNIMMQAKIGTFLVRKSSQPGFLAVTYVDAERKVQKALITIDKNGYCLTGDEEMGFHPSLDDLVKALDYILKFPYIKS